MSIQVDLKHLNGFVRNEEMEGIAPQVKTAHHMLHNGTGMGNDYIGWLALPTNYDKEEFERIQKAAKQIQSDTDILIVIGIGGSYLGARAAIEFLKSQNYNVLPKQTPDIYFAGNTISSASLTELLTICKGKRVSINMISKENFILMHPYTSIHQLCLKLFGDAGILPCILRTARMESIISAVATGEGISLFAQSNFELFHHTNIVSVPLKESPPLITGAVFHSHRNARESQAAALFLEWLKKEGPLSDF